MAKRGCSLQAASLSNFASSKSDTFQPIYGILHSISKAVPLQAESANTSLARLVPGTKRQKASFQACFEASGSFILQHVTNDKRLHTPHLLEGVKHLRIKVLTRSDKRDPQFWWHGHGPKCFQDCYLHNCHWKYSVDYIGTSDRTAAQQHNKGSRQRNQRQPLGKPRWSVAPGSRTLLQSCLCRGRGINLSWDLSSRTTCGCLHTWPPHPLPTWSRLARPQMLPGKGWIGHEPIRLKLPGIPTTAGLKSMPDFTWHDRPLEFVIYIIIHHLKCNMPIDLLSIN